jgi:predicted DsbA family dithiol-disulfide isomerase
MCKGNRPDARLDFARGASYRAAPMRRARLVLLPLTLCAATSLGASCSGGGGGQGTGNGNGNGDSEREGPRIESLPEVDTSELTRAEKRIWVELVNDLLSPCNEPVSVAACVSEHRSCRRCVPAARYLVRLIGEGYERQEIEDHYTLRYSRDTEVEIELEGAPSRGSPMAPVTIVEFSDFECPYCGQAHPILAHVMDELEGRVRLVFRHFPLSAHPNAMPAARAAIAAGNQGKFWEMHDMLFEHQGQLEEDDLARYAEELGLDMARFRTDLASAETQRVIERDRELGERLGVEGTPSFFVNGRHYMEPPRSLGVYVREELDE